MRKHVVLVFGSVFFLLVASVSAAEPSVSISTSARFLVAALGQSANAVLVVRIERHEGNRNLKVSCDGIDRGDYVSSEKSLEGDKGRKVFDIAFNLTPATYRCEAVLTRITDGKIKGFKDFLELTII